MAHGVPPDVLHTFTIPLKFNPECNLTYPIQFGDSKEFASFLVNQSWKNLDKMNIFDDILKKVSISQESKLCLADVVDLLKVIGSCFNETCTRDSFTYKLKLIDSWPKISAGILRRGPFFFLGDYDECKDIEREGHPAHYCTLNMEMKVGKNLPVTAGFCLPATCNVLSIRPIVNFLLEKTGNDFAQVKQIHCQRNETDWWNKFYLIVTLLLIASLLIGGTYMDNKIRRELSVKGDASEGEVEQEERQETDDQPPLFNAPSIALTYRSVPDIKKIFISRATLVDVLCAFSIRISLNHLFRNSAREMSVLHGVKVILGHCCLFSLPYMDTVLSLAANDFSPWLSSFLFNSSLAVDSFLFVTGSVLAYTVRKRILFRGSRKDEVSSTLSRLLLFYLHRITRLWPTLLFSLGFMIFFYSHLGDGPLWQDDGIFGAQCTTTDILNHLTFVSNFSPSLCLPWLWHISLDFQLYLVSPLFLFFLSKKNQTLYIGTGIVICISLFYRAVILLAYNLPTNMFLGMLKENRFEESELSFKLLYGSPLSRCPPFVIGILSGWLMCLPQKMKYSCAFAFCLKLIAYSCLGYALFSPFSESGPAAVVHSVTHRTLWAVGLAIIIWLSENGQHATVQYILASPRLFPISRLSFGIFLTHEPILLWLIWTQRQPSSASSFSHFFFLAVTVSSLSLLAAFLFAICFELPILNIERRLFKKTDCRFNRSSEKPYLHRVQKQLGKSSAVLHFHEKTSLWLENVDNPYATILDMSTHQKEVQDSISNLKKENFLERTALLPKGRD